MVFKSELAMRVSVRSFEAQAAYEFTRSGSGRVREAEPDPSKIVRDERFGKLGTRFSTNVLTSNILHKTGSMNRPRWKGKYQASVVRMVISFESSKYMADSIQLETKVSFRTRWAMWG